jgi:HK97 family phage prohead protease
MTKEIKRFPGYVLKADKDTGIVEAYVSVMGIVDEDIPPDMIENGAFKKTIQERGPAGSNKIRVLHQHRWDEVVGLPLELVEHGRDQLPAELLEKYPDATGGLFTKTQFVLDVQRAREDFALYKAGAMDEWSIGFDTLDSDMDKGTDDESFRRIKEVRLWEYSPVTWGANQATITTNVKDNEQVEDDLLVEPSVEHLQDEAEPQKALTSCEAARLKQDGVEIEFELISRKAQDE